MKKSEIKAALDALKEIKMPKIEDKELRNVLINNHFVLLDAGRKVDASAEDARRVFLEAYKEEQAKIDDLQRKLRTEDDPQEQRAITREIDSHKDYMDAVKALNEKLVKLYDEPVEGLTRIDRARFSEEIQKHDFKMSWFEGFYPMFVLEKAKAK